MAEKKSSEKALRRDIEKLVEKHGLDSGDTVISVSSSIAEGDTPCPPGKVPKKITVTLSNGTKVVTTICK